MGFLAILRLLDWPEIYLVAPEQFEKIAGWSIKDDAGGSYGNVIAIHPGLRGKERSNTIWHEVGHCLWPSKPEWWMYLFGSRMARGGGTGWEWRMDGHTIDELPARSVLLKRAKRQAKRMNGRLSG